MTTLVLLPGLDGTGQLFSSFIAALGSDVKTLVVSYPPDRALDYAALEAIARAYLPKDESFFLLAESFSSPIGIAIAESAPVGMSGLILCCGYARNPMPMLAPLRFTTAMLPVRAVPINLLSFFTMGRFATPALNKALADSLAKVAPAAIRARAKAALSADVSSLLARIGMPVLYLRALEDRVVPKASADSIRIAVPQANIIEIEAPHFLLQVKPEHAAKQTMAFIRSCELRS